MIEVLIALVVIAVGLLGVAALQTHALTQSQGALQATQAMVLASTYADLMRANPQAARHGSYEIDPQMPPTTTPAINCEQAGSSAPVCDSDAIAAWDRYHWYEVLSETLPSGSTARVICNDQQHCATASAQTITVFWDQARTNPNPPGYDCSTNPKVDLACATLGLQP